MRISDWSSDVCSSDLFAFPLSAVDVSKVAAHAVASRGLSLSRPCRMFPAPRLRRRADGGRLGRVGVDHLRQFANAGSGHHRLGDLSDQLAGARSEEHTSELQSLMRNSYAVFCLKKKKI